MIAIKRKDHDTMKRRKDRDIDNWDKLKMSLLLSRQENCS